MGQIIPFHVRATAKTLPKRVTRNKPVEKDGQLNLFAPASRSIRLPTGFSPFEEAYRLDEDEDPRAEEFYRISIREGDSVADAWCNLGIIQSRKGNFNEAFECFTASLQHNPQLFEAHYNIANLYFDQENHRPAKVHYQLALKIDSSFPDLYLNLGLAQAMLGEYTESVASLTRFIELTPPAESRSASALLHELKSSMISD